MQYFVSSAVLVGIALSLLSRTSSSVTGAAKREGGGAGGEGWGWLGAFAHARSNEGAESVVLRGPGVRSEASRPCSSQSVASRGSDMLSYAAGC